MSIFGNILDKIFHHKPAAAAPKAPAPAAPAQSTAPTASAAAPATAAPEPVDVEAVLTDLAAKNPQTLNWRTSIVDVMKLLGLDSSLAARKELADELGYKGDTSDSATMNIWLHKQVMTRLAENGGTVPESLR